ncbi:hypothetical protein L0P88_20640 [Muricauda sp. SCSIO 64092]|uniref:hypothetical protein n=1 Tax=Allomuricauda sp. SCSIO 64092 TaxID=2908842 RepID=UPI001FF6F91F|nr:hypothetical protein [Muricauda sp. SCSIO 64092]UOY06316.1 hypothetical protein L0P88_20640 [Muricauda sp. SCSIO 64092]
MKKSTLVILYWTIVGVFSVVCTLVVLSIDGDSLNVDRWSALELTVQGITEGKYPYSRKDHLGQMSSNFPALGFLGLPFYMLGDVGYLQVFVFIVFSFFLFKTCSAEKTSFFMLFLYLSSPALIWEILAKSDLVSNLFLVFLFIEYWKKIYHGDLFKKPMVWGALISFFVLTRAVVVIPLVILFLRDFWQSKMGIKIKIVLSMALMGLIICLPTLLSVPNWDTLRNLNPISLQTNKAPFIAYLLLLTTFYIPWLTKKHNDLIFYSALIIFMIPFIGMIFTIVQVGWHTTLFNHQFDISYLSMCIPPILIWIKNNLDFEDRFKKA